MDHARLNVPELNAVLLPQIRPINVASTIPNLPGLNVFYPRGLKIKGQQEVRIEAANAGSTSKVNAALFFSDEALTPLPQGNTYKLRGTSTTTVTANAWSQLTVTWDTTLATGVYAVTGLVAESANGQGLRIKISHGAGPEWWNPWRSHFFTVFGLRTMAARLDSGSEWWSSMVDPSPPFPTCSGQRSFRLRKTALSSPFVPSCLKPGKV